MTPKLLCYDFSVLLYSPPSKMSGFWLEGCRAILTWRKQGASRETIKIPSKAHFWRPRSDLHCSYPAIQFFRWVIGPVKQNQKSHDQTTKTGHEKFSYSVKTLMKMHLNASKNRESRFAKESWQLKNQRKILGYMLSSMRHCSTFLWYFWKKLFFFVGKY